MNYSINFLIAFITLSCSNTKNVVTNQTDKLTETEVVVLDGAYKVVQLSSDSTLSNNIVLEFNQKTKTVSGFSGCNDFSGNYIIAENTISFLPLMVTDRMCKGEVNTIEKQFFKTLKSIKTFSIEDNILNLKGDNQLVIVAKKTASENLTSEGKSKIMQEDLVFTYQATTRGFFEIIWLTKNSISFCNERDFKDKKTYTLSAEDWNQINDLLKNIELEKIPELKAPSTTYTHDVAPSATLNISLNGEEFKTCSFDHGNPPKYIKAIVDNIISIKNSTQKL